MCQQLVVVGHSVGGVAVTVRVGEARPAGVTYGTAFRTAPAQVGTVHVVIEQAVRLVLVHDGFHVRAHSFRVVGTAVKPDHEEFAVAGAEFRHHLFAQALVPLLAVTGKLAFAFCLEVVDTQQGVPADADVDARLHTVLAAGVHEVAHDVTLSVAPFQGLHAVRIHVALPKSETGFMGGSEDGKLGSGSLGRLNPLVGVELVGMKNVIVLNRVDTVVALPVHQSVEYVQVVVEYHAQFGFVPFKLVRSRAGTFVVGITGCGSGRAEGEQCQ